MPIFAPAPVVPVTAGYTFSGRYLAVGGIVMASGAGAVDPDGIRWVLEDVTGWDGSPAPVADVTPKVGTDGVWLGDAFYGPRIITVTGSIQADWETANTCMARLGEAIPISEPVVAVIGGAGPDLQAEVRQNEEMLLDGTQSVTRFSLSLIAPDPRKYFMDQVVLSTGLPVTTGGLSLPISLPLSLGATISSGRLSLENAGNVATDPVFAVQGPCPAFTITHLATGEQVQAFDAVPAGRTLYLDTATKLALLDGTELRLVTGTWFNLAPGNNDIQFNAAAFDPAAKLTAIYRSARR